ncbi:MAG TPA: MarR family transcriptional regulator [Acidimicrobiales bacterium]|nr:MarR family transcriptional regulator [Acidimicrobiales bacterium]
MSDQSGPWLTDRQQATWQRFLLTTHLLDEALDRQVLRDAGLPHTHYGILVTLSASPDRRMRMSDLARTLRHSPSRTTHAVASLERSRWVRREPCTDDRRSTWAVLTDDGAAMLERTAPGHVAEVRTRLFDRLSDEQVDQLAAICDILLAGLDPVPADPRAHVASAPAGPTDPPPVADRLDVA